MRGVCLLANRFSPSRGQSLICLCEFSEPAKQQYSQHLILAVSDGKNQPNGYSYTELWSISTELHHETSHISVATLGSLYCSILHITIQGHDVPAPR